MSNKFFKKLCLIFAIIFTFSLMPGTMLCNAEKSVTEDLGEVSILNRRDAPVGDTSYKHTFCKNIQNADKINFTTQIINSVAQSLKFRVHMFKCVNEKCEPPVTHNCYFSSNHFNSTGPNSFIIEGDTLSNCSIDRIELALMYPMDETVKFKSELTASSSTKDPVIKTPDKCSAASSLVAPFAAVATAILGLLAL